MRVARILFFLMILGGTGNLMAQNGEVINDTLWITPNETRPIEFSKALGKVIYIRNIIPADLNPKQRRIQIISSVANEIDEKLITVINNKDIVIALELFTDRYYTLYIKKSNATILSKKLIIR
jgi:hypothetical protein